MLRRILIGMGLTVGLCTLASNVQGSFHLMQIEQAIGGVDGDTSAQAIQLRMRSNGENFLSGARILAFDATGQNPILLKDFTTAVSNGTAGAHVLLASPNFAN